MIRKATFSDIGAMLELGREMHAQSENRHFEFDDDGARLMGGQCLMLPDLCAFVAEKNDRIVGVLLGQVETWPFLHAKYATDLAFFSVCPGAGRLLLRRFEEWAKDQGAVQMVLGVTFGGKDVSAVYTRAGFRQTGGMFVKHLRREKCLG